MATEPHGLGRVLVDRAAPGGWNMAVDQALLQRVEASGESFLRFYEWSPATISLGYFQELASRDQHAASRALDVVRRSTGGGAIIHDRELTYSLVVPSTHRWSRSHRELLVQSHRAVIAVLRELTGCQPEFVGAVPDRAAGPGAAPFLCFQRRSAEDILIGEHKVVGSAQRRSRTALLQHGSILLNASRFAPELPGINDLVSQPIALEEMREALRLRFAAELGITAREVCSSDQLDVTFRAEADAIRVARFEHTSWNKRR